MEKEIKVLTLNLFLRPPGIRTNGSDYKDLRTACFLQQFSASYDVLCLQEVFSTLSRRKSFIIATAKEQGFLYSFESPSPNLFRGQLTDGGLLILSKFPIVDSDFVTYSDSFGPDILSSKGAIYVKLHTRLIDLHVFTTHMQSSYLTSDYTEFLRYRITRRSQLKELKEFIDRKILTSTEPVIITGDFNIDGKEYMKPAKFQVRIK